MVLFGFSNASKMENSTVPYNCGSNGDWTRWLLIVMITLLQFIVPICHSFVFRRCKRESLRVLSLYAFLSFYSWLAFYALCAVFQCSKYGQVMLDLSILCNIILPICYLILVSESCVSTELVSLINILEDVSLPDYINKLLKTYPSRFCIVKCYDYGWFNKRVMTFKDRRLFQFEYSSDISQSPPLDMRGMIRLRLSLNIEFGDRETAEKYREIEIEALNAYRLKGSYVSVEHFDCVPGLHRIICGYADKPRRPFWMNPTIFVLFSIFGLSWPYRLVFWLAVRTRDFTIKKLIFFSYPGRAQGQPDMATNDENNGPAPVTSCVIHDELCVGANEQAINAINSDESIKYPVFYVPSEHNTNQKAIIMQKI